MLAADDLLDEKKIHAAARGGDELVRTLQRPVQGLDNWRSSARTLTQESSRQLWPNAGRRCTVTLPRPNSMVAMLRRPASQSLLCQPIAGAQGPTSRRQASVKHEPSSAAQPNTLRP